MTLEGLFEALGDTPRTLLFSDPNTGLRAVLCLDELGPQRLAAGGVRTWMYQGVQQALADARQLARAMSYKCALATLPVGGAKTVVLDSPDLKREAAFEVLGKRVEELGGLYHCAGDLGTTEEDLAAMRRHTKYVHGLGGSLDRATASSVTQGMAALAADRGVPLGDLRVAIQGCGAIGGATAEALSQEGCKLLVADTRGERAEAMSRRFGAEVLSPEAILDADVDVVSPCATGGVITSEVAGRMRAWGICPGANNAVSPEAGAVLVKREIAHVPDVLASSGAVIVGMCRALRLEGAEDRLEKLCDTAMAILQRVRETQQPADEVAAELARERLAQAAESP